jgi:radical SAM protein (TIGR01212 family)
MTKPYFEFGDYLKKQFPYRVQKISLHAGFTCPNRDGSRGTGGCTYCNNDAFSPGYCRPANSITRQLEEGIRFFARKYPDMRYLAYFQAYTGTYAAPETLRRTYEEALAFPGVAGLVIGTRPDCVPDALLDELAALAGQTFIFVEYGVESTSDLTLQRVNRGHTWQEAVDAIRRTHGRGIPVGAHLILGLPGEAYGQILHHADRLSPLPLTALKLHQLQILRHTVMEADYRTHPEHYRLYTPDEYTGLVVDFLERLRPDIAVDRFISQSPEALLVAPRWGLKNHEFAALVSRRFADRRTWQGKRLSQKHTDNTDSTDLHR